ncbi:hypothetical protein BDV93DRAFT_320357 [Ceratobasidium sp. AG-I]|nr:hypothetical protein BDV93DRAFT_320357 [Ceratobasidium sp. AG-I]
MRFAAIITLSVAGVVLASPAPITRQEDWKTKLGWDGKTTSPAELDPSNVVRPTPGVPAPAALNGGVYFCSDSEFKGNCLFVSGFGSGQCVNFGNEFNDQVSSFGPDPELKCILYSDWDCKGTDIGGYLVNPGSKDLRSQNFNDIASSFKCDAV